MKKTWIKKIFKKKNIFINKNITMFYKKIDKNNNRIRIAISIKKKNIKKSVYRNKIKRILRHYINIYKIHIKNNIKKSYDILIIYNGNNQYEISKIIKINFIKLNHMIIKQESRMT